MKRERHLRRPLAKLDRRRRVRMLRRLPGIYLGQLADRITQPWMVLSLLLITGAILYPWRRGR